jgi:prolyl oligopeptidase
MHYFGWDRQRAIDFFLANAAKTEADIVNEIDRYIGWPGQALAYKIGQLRMLELRSEAEAALGDQFDIRAFHDEMLGAGALPLDILEERMDAWLAKAMAEAP